MARHSLLSEKYTQILGASEEDVGRGKAFKTLGVFAEKSSPRRQSWAWRAFRQRRGSQSSDEDAPPQPPATQTQTQTQQQQQAEPQYESSHEAARVLFAVGTAAREGVISPELKAYLKNLVCLGDVAQAQAHLTLALTPGHTGATPVELALGELPPDMAELRAGLAALEPQAAYASLLQSALQSYAPFLALLRLRDRVPESVHNELLTRQVTSGEANQIAFALCCLVEHPVSLLRHAAGVWLRDTRPAAAAAALSAESTATVSLVRRLMQACGSRWLADALDADSDEPELPSPLPPELEQLARLLNEAGLRAWGDEAAAAALAARAVYGLLVCPALEQRRSRQALTGAGALRKRLARDAEAARMGAALLGAAEAGAGGVTGLDAVVVTMADGHRRGAREVQLCALVALHRQVVVRFGRGVCLLDPAGGDREPRRLGPPPTCASEALQLCAGWLTAVYEADCLGVGSQGLRRFFVLQAESLVCFAAPDAEHPLASIQLHDARLVVDPEGCGFEIQGAHLVSLSGSPGRGGGVSAAGDSARFRVCGGGDHELHLWVCCIQSAIRRSKARTRSLSLRPDALRTKVSQLTGLSGAERDNMKAIRLLGGHLPPSKAAPPAADDPDAPQVQLALPDDIGDDGDVGAYMARYLRECAPAAVRLADLDNDWALRVLFDFFAHLRDYRRGRQLQLLLAGAGALRERARAVAICIACSARGQPGKLIAKVLAPLVQSLVDVQAQLGQPPSADVAGFLERMRRRECVDLEQLQTLFDPARDAAQRALEEYMEAFREWLGELHRQADQAGSWVLEMDFSPFFA